MVEEIEKKNWRPFYGIRGGSTKKMFSGKKSLEKKFVKAITTPLIPTIRRAATERPLSGHRAIERLPSAHRAKSFGKRLVAARRALGRGLWANQIT